MSVYQLPVSVHSSYLGTPLVPFLSEVGEEVELQGATQQQIKDFLRMPRNIRIEEQSYLKHL